VNLRRSISLSIAAGFAVIGTGCGISSVQAMGADDTGLQETEVDVVAEPSEMPEVTEHGEDTKITDDLAFDPEVDTGDTDDTGEVPRFGGQAGAALDTSIDVFGIEVGHCLRGIDFGLITSAQDVSCDRSHQYEVYHAYNFPDGAFPGDTIIETEADTVCIDAFEPFVGIAYADSVYGYTVIQPTQQTWDKLGDREVLCLIGMYDESEKVGTARATAR